MEAPYEAAISGSNPQMGTGSIPTGSGAASVTRIPRVSQDRQCLTWSRVPVLPTLARSKCTVPPPRSGAASVVVKGQLYVFGGYGGGTGRLDDFYSFNFSTSSWEQVQVLSRCKPGCRENNGVVISDSSRSIYLFGGYNGNSWLNDLWKFDIESKEWSCIQQNTDQLDDGAGSNVSAADAATDNNMNPGSLAAAGGVAAAAVATGNNRVQGKIPSRRFGYVSVVHDNKFVLFGGFDGSRWLNDMYVFDFATAQWQEIVSSGVKPTARSCPAWAKDDTHVYIQGGYDGVERKSDFFACDLSTYHWTEMPCLGQPPSPRYFHSCCLYGNKMFLYGGYSGNERLADMYAYDFETNHWSQVDCTSGDAPSGRSSLVAQVYGNSLYIFGGYNGNTVLNDFYKFRLKPIGVPPPALVSDLGRLIDSSEFGDISFLVEGKQVYANRAILAIRSEYFRVMLCGGMRESTFQKQERDVQTNKVHRIISGDDDTDSSEDFDSPIPLPDVSHSVFLKVLEFLYTDTVRDVGSLSVGIPLLIAGEQFMLDRLKALCEDMIRRDIDVENVIGILVAAHRHNAIGLKDIALDFILKNLADSPRVMDGLDDLRSEPDLLLEIIKRSTNAQHQNHRYHAEGDGSAAGAGGNLQGGGTGGPDFPSPGPFDAGSEWSARR